MPGEILTQTTTAQCTHGGVVTHVPSQPRVRLTGAPALVAPDRGIVAGCAFTIGTKPSPCVTVEWAAPSLRVKAMGQPVLLRTSIGTCKSPEQAPQGVAIVGAVQPRVRAQ